MVTLIWAYKTQIDFDYIKMQRLIYRLKHIIRYNSQVLLVRVSAQISFHKIQPVVIMSSKNIHTNLSALRRDDRRTHVQFIKINGIIWITFATESNFADYYTNMTCIHHRPRTPIRPTPVPMQEIIINSQTIIKYIINILSNPIEYHFLLFWCNLLLKL